MEGIRFTPLTRISVAGGDVFHGLRADDETFASFGEVYFSRIDFGVTKGWKCHREMTLNLMVPCGAVSFFIVREEQESGHALEWCRIDMDDDAAYGRLTVAPGLWLAFRGSGQGTNIVCNLASIPHDPDEQIVAKPDRFSMDLFEPR